MSGLWTELTGVPRLLVLGLFGAAIGATVALFLNPLPVRPRTRTVPAVYRVPKIPGGTALRLAMVHDVLHERYLRHGAAWYAQRCRDARAVIAAAEAHPATPPAPTYLDALDDLAIGLEAAGEYDEAIATQRKKLALVSPIAVAPPALPTTQAAGRRYTGDIELADLRQILAARDLTPLQHHQYTTCANLGTILVHQAMPKALANDPAAKAQVREGLQLIRQAVAINPGAHFGRERWQAIVIAHLLAATEHPDLLTGFDAIGEPFEHGFRSASPLSRVFRSDPPGGDEVDARVHFRMFLPEVGIDATWAAIVGPDYVAPMPFDEPTLAIVGMWTLGSGPSPHFALALADTMAAVGQGQIAWNAYERAAELKDRFWPDPAVRERIVAYCRERQAAIADVEAGAGGADAWQDHMRQVHARELAWGVAYQTDYQAFEAARIAAGVPPGDPDFYRPFFEHRPPIASPPGLADDVAVTQKQATAGIDVLPCALLGLGLATALGALLPEKRAARGPVPR